LRIILGSSSQWRKQIMHDVVRPWGCGFETEDPKIDESIITGDSLRQNEGPQVLTLRLAVAKSHAVRPRITGPAVLVTSDQVVVCGGFIRGKPEDEQQAWAYLISYREHPAECVTAVLAYNTATHRDVLVIDRVAVHLKGLTNEAIEKIVKKGTIFSCAGGFSVGDPWFFERYVDRIDGTLFSAMGLPLELTRLIIADVAGELP
jgi:septum formation protein